jgi:hypothetical protein
MTSKPLTDITCRVDNEFSHAFPAAPLALWSVFSEFAQHITYYSKKKDLVSWGFTNPRLQRPLDLNPGIFWVDSQVVVPALELALQNPN